MSFIDYKDTVLYCEDISLKELAEEYGTPLYVYSKQQILHNYRTINAAFGETEHCVYYAVKANSNPTILKILAEDGAGADIVSAGELYLALKSGFDPEKIVFAGVGKRDDEIEYALNKNILMFNVESVPELQAISRIALRLNKTARIAIRINPHIDVQSHPHITTGLHSTKFGIEDTKALEVYKLAMNLPSIEVRGIHTHIGSQITSIEPFVETAKSLAMLVQQLREAGIPIQHIDFGGGFGVPYHNVVLHEALPVENSASPAPAPSEFIEAIMPILQSTGCSLWTEPGRAIVANAGLLLTKVLYIKENTSKKFVIVDSGMTELIRPVLYNAYHQIVPIVIESYEHLQADVVGPICESGDFFARDRAISKIHAGDYLAIMTTGAYGFVNASNYNGRLRPAEVLVNGERVRVIRSRQTFEELI
jgi:diaminopimelate decarboxylase